MVRESATLVGGGSMAEADSTAQQSSTEPDAGLKQLERLVGTWEVTGEAQGRLTYEWMEGGHFLIRHVDLEQGGRANKGIEIIGRERGFGAPEPSEDIRSRYYDIYGNTLDYVYELEGDTLT